MFRAMLDAGHGGKELGARNNYVNEKDINLLVSQRVREILEAHSGIEVAMTRNRDTEVKIGERSKQANLWQADIFVSVHHNATGYANSEVEGYEIIHSLYGEGSKTLALLLAYEFEQAGRPLHAVRSRESEVNKGTDFYHVIRETKMPAVITEWAFMDTDDYKNIDTEEKLEREALAIAKGIYSYFYGQEMPIKENSNKKTHWAKLAYDTLKKRYEIHEERYEDDLKRGEHFSLMWQMDRRIKLLEKTLNFLKGLK